MKKFAVVALLAAAILAVVFAFAGTGSGGAAADDAASYLRVHIRANSNGAEDQAVKYKVRDAVVQFLTPTVAACETKAEAMQKIGAKLSEAEEVAEEPAEPVAEEKPKRRRAKKAEKPEA